MNQDYSTGNRIVDEVGRINISGNIIPMVWFQAIRYPNGKPNVNAIIILADIVYWYRPTEIRDEITGQVVGRRKKFRDDLLQRSYGQISELFGLTKKQVVTAALTVSSDPASASALLPTSSISSVCCRAHAAAWEASPLSGISSAK